MNPIKNNLERVRTRIAQAALRSGRCPEDVRLVAVTKSVGAAEVEELVRLGVGDLGENRPETSTAKIEAVQQPVRWHMIGAVQRRKAKDVVLHFDTVDSVDRIELGDELNKRCVEYGRTLDVLLEVNVSGETSKHGFQPSVLSAVLEHSARWPALRVQGLMTMAPFDDDPENVRPVFAKLRALAQQFGLPELSMGMSNDFEIAIEEGATQVRIGTALFE